MFWSKFRTFAVLHGLGPFPEIFLSSLTFSVFNASLKLNLGLMAKVNWNYTDLRYLQDIKVLTQQTMRAGHLAAYCSGENWKHLPTILISSSAFFFSSSMRVGMLQR